MCAYVLKRLLSYRFKLTSVSRYNVQLKYTFMTMAPGNTSIQSKDSKTLDMYTSVQDYYAGKSVFLTGSTGFLGKVLLEKLLHTCTKLDKVYLLVRGNDGEPISRRVHDIFENPLFQILKERMPGSLKKVIPIAGDLTEPNLGIKDDDIKTLTEKVSVVFHSAASVRFDNPWDTSLKVNYEGSMKVLELCQRIEKLEAYVHVSTAYANTRDVGNNVVEEKVYPAPGEIDQVYNFVKKYNNDKKKTKDFLGGLANTYTYSKSLTEAYIAENYGRTPTIIVRPSIVGPKLDEPQVGWLDNWLGATRVLLDVSKGYNRVTHSRGDLIVDFIPVDYVANTCIVAAAKHNKSKNLRVYNACSSDVNPVTWREAHNFFCEDTVKHGWNDIPFPFIIFTQSWTLVKILTFLLQVLPAHLADFYLMITGKETKYVKTENFVIHLRDSPYMNFFISNMWLIKSGNVRSLYLSMSELDRQLFPCDPANIDWKKYFYLYSQGVNKFLVSKNNK